MIHVLDHRLYQPHTFCQICGSDQETYTWFLNQIDSEDSIHTEMSERGGQIQWPNAGSQLVQAVQHCTILRYTTMQRQTAVTAYFSSKQLLLFAFACESCSTVDQ